MIIFIISCWGLQHETHVRLKEFMINLQVEQIYLFTEIKYDYPKKFGSD